MKILLINMNRSKERLEIMNKRLSTLSLKFERISGVDGNNISRKDLNNLRDESFRYPNKMTQGEIGCFLSHKKCWETLIKSNEKWALILEDDIVISQKARQYFTSEKWIPNECRIIQFNCTADTSYYDKTITLANSKHLMRVKCSDPCGAYAYIISREAAIEAVRLSEYIEGPVDNFLFGSFFPFSSSINNWRLQECVVKVIDDVGTTILGRGSMNRAYSLCRVHPTRLSMKLCNLINKLFLKQYKQYYVE